MKYVIAKFIPQPLLPEQKEHRAAGANDLIQTTTNKPDFLKKVITRYESWVYGYDPQMKAQLSQWKSPGSPCPKMVQQSHSKIKTTLTVFFGYKVSSIVSTPLQAKQLVIKSTTSLFCIGREMQCNENGHSYG